MGLPYILPSPVGDLTLLDLPSPSQSPFSQESSGLTVEGGLRACASPLGPHVPAPQVLATKPGILLPTSGQ